MKSLLPLSLLIRPDKNDPRPLVIYHGRHCPDGFAAALAAWLFYEGQAEFLGLDHGDIKSVADLPELTGRAVYILDFSFSKELMQAIEAQAAKLVMLDHHRSAAEKLDGFACRCGVVHFDMNKSGARLAWEFFLMDQPLPDLVRFVEDRDIWVWQYPESPGFLAALDMEPHTFERWHEIARFDAQQRAAYMGGKRDNGAGEGRKAHHVERCTAKCALRQRFKGMGDAEFEHAVSEGDTFGPTGCPRRIEVTHHVVCFGQARERHQRCVVDRQAVVEGKPSRVKLADNEPRAIGAVDIG